MLTGLLLLFMAVLPLAYTATGSCGGSVLSAKLVQTMLDQHNQKRSLIVRGKQSKRGGGFAPTGKNMYRLKWSCDLEQQAQRWANRCTFTHSQGKDRINAGENLYWIYGSGDMSSGTRMPGATTSWWNEYTAKGPISNSQNKLTSSEFNKGLGHWSQMAWGATTELGCGFGSCKHSGQPSAYVVCQYRVPGNVLNQAIYDLGTPCKKDSDCTTYKGSRCSTSDQLCYTP